MLNWSIWLAAMLFAVGCGDGSTPVAATKPGAQAGTRPAGPVRIVSLSPAISRTLVDFSLNRQIVGRTPHCESLNPAIPVVGDLLNLDFEQLIAVQPTHVLVQPPSSGIDERLVQLAKQKGWVLGQWKLNSRDDIESLVRDLPGTLFTEGSPEREAATARSAELINDIANELSPGPDRLFAGRILMVSSVDPVMAFGTQTYLNDVLAALAGNNAVSATGWVQLSLEDVVRLNPQAIIIVRHGEAMDPIETVAGPLWTIDVEATQNRRVGVLNHPDAFMPCSGVVGVARELRKILRSFQESGP